MFRLSTIFLALAIAGSPSFGQDKAPPRGKASAGTEILDLLAKRVNVEKFEGTLDEAISRLRDEYGVPLVLDPSLRTEDDGPVEKLPVRWPALKSVRLESVLRMVGDQINGMPMVRPDRVAIVGTVYGLYESGVLKQLEANDPFGEEDPGLLTVTEMQKSRPLTQRALVNASFKGKTLVEIIDAISEATGANVVLAPQVAEQGNQPLTVRFANTPVDAAVRTLAEMTDLGVIEDANVLMVTSVERAEARAKQAEAKRKARLAEHGAVLGVGGLGGVAAAAAPADLAVQVAELKDQNEQLKKQLDEIQKLLKK